MWFQDEARFGQRNTTTRLWAIKGTRPRAVQQQQFENAYCFGAVCINDGRTEALLSPVANSSVMSTFLAQISESTPNGAHSVVVVDKASYHQLLLAHQFDNLTLIHLPPASPELNPIEQVWSWLRQHYLANRCFKDHEDILTAVSHAWNNFRANTKRVISMCRRSWAIL